MSRVKLLIHRGVHYCAYCRTPMTPDCSKIAFCSDVCEDLHDKGVEFPVK